MRFVRLIKKVVWEFTSENYSKEFVKGEFAIEFEAKNSVIFVHHFKEEFAIEFAALTKNAQALHTACTLCIGLRKNQTIQDLKLN